MTPFDFTWTLNPRPLFLIGSPPVTVPTIPIVFRILSPDELHTLGSNRGAGGGGGLEFEKLIVYGVAVGKACIEHAVAADATEKVGTLTTGFGVDVSRVEP